MKTKLCLALLIFCSGLVAQVPASLQAEVKRLYTAAHDIDITALTEMLCSTEADVYEKLDTYFQSDEQKFRYVFTNAKYNYGREQTVDGKTYFPITFRNIVRVTFFKPIDVAKKQEDLKKQFNATSIVYDKSRNAFLITYQAKLVAIQGDKWQFAFADETFPAIWGDCMTESIKNKLGI